jgi:integrase
MSIKNSKTTTSGIEWNTMLGLLHQLKKDKKYKEYLLIGTGSFLGLRAKDLLSLRWADIFEKEEIILQEHKTGKKRKITINPTLQDILHNVYMELSKNANFSCSNYLFTNKAGNPVSIQYTNKLLHKTFDNYNIKIINGSSHSLRKTFGRRVWEKDNKSERSLIYLSQIFNHSSTEITRRYIGIVNEDIKNIYLSL